MSKETVDAIFQNTGKVLKWSAISAVSLIVVGSLLGYSYNKYDDYKKYSGGYLPDVPQNCIMKDQLGKTIISAGISFDRLKSVKVTIPFDKEQMSWDIPYSYVKNKGQWGSSYFGHSQDQDALNAKLVIKGSGFELHLYQEIKDGLSVFTDEYLCSPVDKLESL